MLVCRSREKKGGKCQEEPEFERVKNPNMTLKYSDGQRQTPSTNQPKRKMARKKERERAEHTQRIILPDPFFLTSGRPL